MHGIRKVQIATKRNQPIGFSIRGGLEHGIGIYVTQVKNGSAAHKEGIQVGDEVLMVNNYVLKHSVHSEVLNLIRSVPPNKLELTVRYAGKIPIKDNVNDNLEWRYISNDFGERNSSKTSSLNPTLDDEVELTINIPQDHSLGCSICSGPPEMPGIFIQSLKSGGIAESSGLLVGDQLAFVNGYDLRSCSHQQAVNVLKNQPSLRCIVWKAAGTPLFEEKPLYIRHREDTTDGSLQNEEVHPSWVQNEESQSLQTTLTNSPSYPNETGSVRSHNPFKMFPKEHVEGRQVKLISIFKAGFSSLGIHVRQSPDGRLLVSDLDSGSAAYKNGAISIGDQILLADWTRLLKMTAHDAELLLSNAFHSSKPAVQLIIAKEKKTAYDEEHEVFV